MYRETLETGFEFDEFWYENARQGIACFFSWTGTHRATVLVVLDEE